MIKKTITTRQMSAEIATSNSEDNKIDLVFTTGYKGLRSDWEETFYEELAVTEEAVDLSRLNAGAPFLSQHEQTVSQTLGVVERAWIENGIGKATVRLSKRRDVQDIIQDVKDGILRNISVGYKVTEYTDTTPKGERTRTLLATKWQPLEISLVAVGFDPMAQTLRQIENTNEVSIIEENRMTEEEMKQLEALLAKKASMETVVETPVAEEVREEKPAVEDTIVVPAVEEIKIDLEEEKRAAVVEFIKRSGEIKSAVKAANLAPEYADQLIERGLSIQDASAEIFKTLENQNQKQASVLKEKTMTKREQVVEALMYRADSVKFKCSEENTLKGASLIQICEAIVPRQAGESDQAFAKRAITSSDLADVLVNASNKIVEQEFHAGATYSKWTKQMTLRDFKSTPVVQLSAYELATPSEGGDYAEASLTDSKEEIQLRQRGKILSLSLKAVVNDDAGVLQQLPEFAKKAGQLDVEAAVFGVINANAAMSDGKALFHADHGNLIAAAGTNVDVASMAAAEQKLMEATGLGGIALELKPKYIIVSPKYAMKARQIVGALVSDSASNFNPYAGSGIEVIVSNRLTDKESWYVVADPAQMPAIAVGTLEGMEMPQVSTEEQFSSSNLRMKVEYHNAAKAINYQAIIKLTVTPAT